MNRNARRRPTSSHRRGLHKMQSQTAYGFEPVTLHAAPVATKKVSR